MVVLLISSSLFFYALLRQITESKKLISRIKNYTKTQDNLQKARKSNKKIDFGFGGISRKIKDIKILDAYKRKIQGQILSAHILLKPEEFITVSFFFSITVGLVMLVLASESKFSIFFALSAAVIGFFVPNQMLKAKIKTRLRILNNQLGDTIGLISNSLKAGFSFLQAVETVTKELTGPMAEEFSMLQKEMNLGVSTEKALENLVLRMPSKDLELVVTAVLIQRQIGGNLAEILDNISFTINERIKIKGEIKTITAQGMMSGLIISLLPPGIFLILFLINQNYMSVLFRDPLGLFIMGFAIFMEFLGILFVRKIVNIEI